MNFELNLVNTKDDLDLLVHEINTALWDDANEMSVFEVSSLVAYLERQDTRFVVCHESTSAGRVLLGIASARLEYKPYGNERWLYVDEVDVCVDQRRRGVGAAIMRKLMEIARNCNCEELWLGAEQDNVAANALYHSLQPDDASSFIGYTYEIDQVLVVA